VSQLNCITRLTTCQKNPAGQSHSRSTVLYPARGKDFLDWETINKLCEQNGDFARFVEDVKIDFESKRIHKSEYDEIPKDPEKYIGEKLGIEQS